MATGFPHENLDCYRLAVGVARWVAASRFPPRCANLTDQAVRAAQSVVLNIAEGAARGGPAGRNHFARGRGRLALGSAAELCSVLDLVEVAEAAPRQAEIRRIGAMLRRLGG
jgi:four helix bundle protein